MSTPLNLVGPLDQNRATNSSDSLRCQIISSICTRWLTERTYIRIHVELLSPSRPTKLANLVV